ncbi:MAG: hypothetical protein A2Y34_07255 [Spirochaetes bacterium GWC1_27_15]|nr:MAG: hypothetical protein A2Z98_10940 [Spirochaetes bacterium GWB1_27_13]OHD28185.1 MAG: hypothetical protein A2Y34_07255 [Spirochaetes bacterium GWC1_27_15]
MSNKMDLTFDDICKFIEKDQLPIVDKLNKALGLLAIIIPAFINPALGGVVASLSFSSDLIGIKGEIVDFFKDIFKKIINKNDNDVLSRYERMSIAYSLVFWTAFFDSVENGFLKIETKLKLSVNEKLYLTEKAIEELNKERNIKNKNEKYNYKGILIEFPNPFETDEDREKKLGEYYKSLTDELKIFVEKLALWDESDKKNKEIIRSIIDGITDDSIKKYKEQYYELATKYQEFFVWINIKDHNDIKKHVQDIDKNFVNFKQLLENNNKNIDIGIRNLQNIIKSIPQIINKSKTNDVLSKLENIYSDNIEKSIIQSDKEIYADINLPKKKDIFIPQAFKKLEYKRNYMLENDAIWADIDIEDDICSNLLKYLLLPNTNEAPILILGHPGSGKSLLTEMIASTYYSNLFTTIRVELRDINANQEICFQIEEQLKNILHNSKINWSDLVENHKNKSLLVILDGYDELLQVSGKVFSDYLRIVQRFQNEEKRLGRDVKVIITSRVTLIDKADIPDGCAVFKLMEFDDKRKNSWITKWNKNNINYYKDKNIEKFTLPDNKNISSLAEHPLLLLMLGLYDLENNQLKKEQNLTRTDLYYNLLIRFVKREREKDSKLQNEIETELNNQMKRLGVAAIGMFNRRRIHIREDELNYDLNFYKVENNDDEKNKKKLSQAELLLGSFFFVYKSKSTFGKIGCSDEKDTEKSYEFMHNTFNEFLTADFIFNLIVEEIDSVNDLRKNKKQTNKLFINLENINYINKLWFYSLMLNQLFSKPVIIEMLREKFELYLKEDNKKEFLEGFDIIIDNHIKKILMENKVPEIMIEDNQPIDNDKKTIKLPLFGYLSIYTINIIIIRTIIDKDGYIFNEKNFNIEDNDNNIEFNRPWDRLIYLWESWFSIETLNELSAILFAKRENDNVILQSNAEFNILPTENRFDMISNINNTLANNIIAGITDLAKYELNKDNIKDIENIHEKLKSEKIDIEIDLLINKCKFYRLYEYNSEEANKLVDYIIDEDLFSDNDSLMLELIKLLRFYNLKYNEIDIYRKILHPKFFTENYNPELIIELIKLVKYFNDRDFLEKIYENLDYLNIIRRNNPELIIELIKLAKYFNDRDFLERIYKESISQRLFIKYCSPKLIIEIIKLAINFNDRNFFKSIYRQLFHSKFLAENYNPELIIELIKLGKLFNDREFLERIYDNPNYLNIIRIDNPELIIEIIKLGKYFNDRDFIKRIYDELVTQSFRINNPKLIIEVIKLEKYINFNERYLDKISLNEIYFDINDNFIELLYFLFSSSYRIESVELLREYQLQIEFELYSFSIGSLQILLPIVIEMGDRELEDKINMLLK